MHNSHCVGRSRINIQLKSKLFVESFCSVNIRNRYWHVFQFHLRHGTVCLVVLSHTLPPSIIEYTPKTEISKRKQYEKRQRRYNKFKHLTQTLGMFARRDTAYKLYSDKLKSQVSPVQYPKDSTLKQARIRDSLEPAIVLFEVVYMSGT